MFDFGSDSRFTNHLHYMLNDRIRAVIWDLLFWMNSDHDIDSLYDLLRYSRLLADYGDLTQGQLFFELIKKNKLLKSVAPDIAERYIKRGEANGILWLKSFGLYIQQVQRESAAAGKK
jgi:hypothetical protein